MTIRRPVLGLALVGACILGGVVGGGIAFSMLSSEVSGQVVDGQHLKIEVRQLSLLGEDGEVRAVLEVVEDEGPVLKFLAGGRALASIGCNTVGGEVQAAGREDGVVVSLFGERARLGIAGILRRKSRLQRHLRQSVVSQAPSARNRQKILRGNLL